MYIFMNRSRPGTTGAGCPCAECHGPPDAVGAGRHQVQDTPTPAGMPTPGWSRPACPRRTPFDRWFLKSGELPDMPLQVTAIDVILNFEFLDF